MVLKSCMVIWHKLGISENIIYYRILMDGYAGVSFGYISRLIFIRDSFSESAIFETENRTPSPGFIPPLSALRRIRRGEKIRGGRVGL